MHKTTGKCENSPDIDDLNIFLLIFIRWNNGIKVVCLSPYLLEIHTEIFTSEML